MFPLIDMQESPTIAYALCMLTPLDPLFSVVKPGLQTSHELESEHEAQLSVQFLHM
jgi:hypothetical protein